MGAPAGFRACVAAERRGVLRDQPRGDITIRTRADCRVSILNLGAIRRDVVWYVRMLEEAMIQATAEFGITAERVAGRREFGSRAYTEEKLGAIGVRISRWVTSHGLAYNVSTDCVTSI